MQYMLNQVGGLIKTHQASSKLKSLEAAQREKALGEVSNFLQDTFKNDPKLLEAWIEGASGIELKTSADFRRAALSLMLDVNIQRATALHEAYGSSVPIGLSSVAKTTVGPNVFTTLLDMAPIVVGSIDFNYNFNISCARLDCSLTNLRFD